MNLAVQFGKKSLRDLKMQSFWMFPVGSESGDREPGPRDESAEEKEMGRQSGTGVRWSEAMSVWKKPGADCILEPSEGAQASKHFAFWTKEAVVVEASGYSATVPPQDPTAFPLFEGVVKNPSMQQLQSPSILMVSRNSICGLSSHPLMPGLRGKGGTPGPWGNCITSLLCKHLFLQLLGLL